MADAPKILGTDTLRQAYPKLNNAIDNSNEALSAANTAKSKADSALSNSENTQTQLDTIVISGDSGPEAAQARVDVLGTAYTTLKARGDADQLRAMKQAVVLSDFTTVTDAINYATANGIPALFVDAPTLGAHNVDFKGLEIVGTGTDISGSLKGVKRISNAKVKGYDQTDKQVGDFDNISGSVTSKIIHKVSDSEIHVYSKKPFANEYLDFRFERDVSTLTNSAGSPAELTRLTGVFNLTEAYTQLTTPSSMIGTWEAYTILLQSASGIPNARNSALKFYRNTTATAGSIDFEAYADEYGFISLGFYCTGTSAEDITIRIGTQFIATVSAKSLTGSPYFIIKKIQSNVKGVVTVRIEKNGSAPVYVCSNMYRLHESPTKAKFDNVAFFDDGNGYMTNNGAVDYAMINDADGLYYGSYHGGETLVSFKLLSDKTNISSSGNNGRFFACKKFRLDQTTQIGSFLQSRTSMQIGRDGIFDFSFAFTGDATLRTLYTTMTTSANSFNYVMYPKMVSTTTDGDYFFGKTNRIVQENTTTNQRITTLFNRYENENNNNGGVFVRVTTGAYNKVYYGPVVAGLRRITDINGSNTRIFE
ncbi:hypothetical protein [Cytobacillus firmus]|uniref:hypothetical protein n=1 Tax=Cytobacillus firmus TaxID=1399 RepID=UPI001CFEA9F1|nr:hypothetical protein [Cytobacillus firmus]